MWDPTDPESVTHPAQMALSNLLCESVLLMKQEQLLENHQMLLVILCDVSFAINACKVSSMLDKLAASTHEAHTNANGCAACKYAFTTILAEQAAPYTDMTRLMSEAVHHLKGVSNISLNTNHLQGPQRRCLKTAWTYNGMHTQADCVTQHYTQQHSTYVTSRMTGSMICPVNTNFSHNADTGSMSQDGQWTRRMHAGCIGKHLQEGSPQAVADPGLRARALCAPGGGLEAAGRGC